MNNDRLEPSTVTMHKNVQRNRYMNLLENRRIEIETHNEFEQRLARQRDRDALINRPHGAKSSASKVDVTKKEGWTNDQSDVVHMNGANRKRSSVATSSMNGHTAKRAKHDVPERLSSSVALDIEHSSSDSDNDGDADSDGDVGSAPRINTRRGASSSTATATAAAAGSADFMSTEEVTALVKQVYLARQSAATAAGTSGTSRSNSRRASSSSSSQRVAGVLPDINPLVDTFFQLLEHIVTDPVDSATCNNNIGNNRDSNGRSKQSSEESQRQKYASALRAAIDRIAPQPKTTSSSSASTTQTLKGQTKRSAPKDGSSKPQRNVSKASTLTVSKPAATADRSGDSSSSEDEAERNSVRDDDSDGDSDGDGGDSVAIDHNGNHTRKEERVNGAKDVNNAVALASSSSSSSLLWSSSVKGKKTALTVKKSLRRTEEDDEDEDDDEDEGNGDHTHSASAKVSNRMDVVAEAVPVVVDLTSPESAAATSQFVKPGSVYATAARDRDTSSVASSRAESTTTATTSMRAPTEAGAESASEPKKLTTKERIALERAKAAAKKLQQQQQQQQRDGNTAPDSAAPGSAAPGSAAAAVADTVSDAGTVSSRATAGFALRALGGMLKASEAVKGLSLHASPFDTAFTSPPPPPASAPAPKSVTLSGSGEAVGDLVVSNSFTPTATTTTTATCAAVPATGGAQQREAPVIVAKKSQPTAASAKLPRAAEIRGQFTLNRSSSDSLLPNGTSPAAQTLSNYFKAGTGSGVTVNERDRHLEPPPPVVLRAHSADDASWPRQQSTQPSALMPAPHTTHNPRLATSNNNINSSNGPTTSTHVKGSIAYSNKPPASNSIRVVESEAERRAREKKRMETDKARVMLQDDYKDPKQEDRERRKLMKKIGRYIPKIAFPSTTTAVVSTGGVTPRSTASSANNNNNNNNSRPLYNTISAAVSSNNPGRRLSGETSSSTTTLSHHSSSAGSSSIQISVAPKPSRPVGSGAVSGSGSAVGGAGVERRSM